MKGGQEGKVSKRRTCSPVLPGSGHPTLKAHSMIENLKAALNQKQAVVSYLMCACAQGGFCVVYRRLAQI